MRNALKVCLLRREIYSCKPNVGRWSIGKGGVQRAEGGGFEVERGGEGHETDKR